MTTLELYIADNKLDPIQTMNRLADAGLVSDNCVGPETVASANCWRAVQWLERNKQAK